MAKKKKKKQTKGGFEYKLEVYGLLLLLASVLGIGKYGPVGRMISSFALFKIICAPAYNKFCPVNILTAEFVPTGIKTGVLISPWGVINSPALAFEFLSFFITL